jgi:hypothetical protein
MHEERLALRSAGSAEPLNNVMDRANEMASKALMPTEVDVLSSMMDTAA